MPDEALSALFLSLRVALLSTITATVIGVLFARMMVRRQFPGKEALDTLFLLPLVLPPTVIGFGLLLLLGRHGPIGRVFQGHLLFTWWAAVVASTVVAFPLAYQNARAAFAQVDPVQENAARTLGAGETRVFFTISVPLAWPGILSGILLAFTRALGEFGATLMVAGNIPGQTQTVPMAIYFAVEAGDYRTALPLMLLVLLLSFVTVFGLRHWSHAQLTRFTAHRRA